MANTIFCLAVVVLATAYVSISFHSVYMESKEFQKVQTKAKKSEQSRVNILV
jgi:hypothetical protein